MNWRPAEKTMLGEMQKKQCWAKCRKNMGGPNAEKICAGQMQKKYGLANAEKINPKGTARSAAPFGPTF